MNNGRVWNEYEIETKKMICCRFYPTHITIDHNNSFLLIFFLCYSKQQIISFSIFGVQLDSTFRRNDSDIILQN
jgi:hypothetical protein